MQSVHHDVEVHRCWIAACALAFLIGALLTLGCNERDERPAVSAAAVREDARAARATESDYMKQQLDALESKVEQVQRDAQQEIQQARAQAEEFPVAEREKLMLAIERTESAREDVSERLDELQRASNAGWDLSRQRVVDAIEELNEVRRDVVASFAGGEPARSDAS